MKMYMNTLNDCNKEDDLFLARKQNSTFKKSKCKVFGRIHLKTLHLNQKKTQ
jgi:hypothetical protein